MIILKLLCFNCSSFINIPQNWQGEIQINYCGNPPMVLREDIAYPLPNFSNPQKNTTVLCVEDPSLASKTPFQIPLTYNSINFTSLPLINFVHTDRCYRKNNTKECTIDSINAITQPKMDRLFNQAYLPILSLQLFFQRLGQIIQTHMLKFSNGVMLFDPKEILTVAVTEFEGNQILIIGYLLYYNFFLHGFINFKLSNANNSFYDKSKSFGVEDLIETTKEWVKEDVFFCNIEEAINKLTILATKKITMSDKFISTDNIEEFRKYLIKNFDFLFRI